MNACVNLLHVLREENDTFDHTPCCSAAIELAESCGCCVAGQSGASPAALRRPEGEALLPQPGQIHELWARGRHGN